jgi:hypothetical protein
MNLRKFFTNVGDKIEGALKSIGFGDKTSAEIATTAASIMADFTTKWATSEGKILLAAAKGFVGKASTDGISSAAKALVAEVAKDSLKITKEQAMDALRVHLMIGKP